MHPHRRHCDGRLNQHGRAAWILYYVKSAYAVTDVPDQVNSGAMLVDLQVVPICS
ncbi:hypothetical protein M405DRAFT_813028 [Rhizopogon salebrosus TDB-379]|nr:hypothetical protein M405DRAFT_813028 [Rhizopogon salebrosus TDB-379]